MGFLYYIRSGYERNEKIMNVFIAKVKDLKTRLTYEAEVQAPSIDKAKWHLEAEGYRILTIGEKK